MKRKCYFVFSVMCLLVLNLANLASAANQWTVINQNGVATVVRETKDGPSFQYNNLAWYYLETSYTKDQLLAKLASDPDNVIKYLLTTGYVNFVKINKNGEVVYVASGLVNIWQKYGQKISQVSLLPLNYSSLAASEKNGYLKVQYNLSNNGIAIHNHLLGDYSTIVAVPSPEEIQTIISTVSVVDGTTFQRSDEFRLNVENLNRDKRQMYIETILADMYQTNSICDSTFLDGKTYNAGSVAYSILPGRGAYNSFQACVKLATYSMASVDQLKSIAVDWLLAGRDCFREKIKIFQSKNKLVILDLTGKEVTRGECHPSRYEYSAQANARYCTYDLLTEQIVNYGSYPLPRVMEASEIKTSLFSISKTGYLSLTMENRGDTIFYYIPPQ